MVKIFANQRAMENLNPDKHSHKNSPVPARLPAFSGPYLGTQHFAYLRACAEGVDRIDAARRYLGVDHGNESMTAHRQVVDAVRAVARRQADAAWRLVGLSIGIQKQAQRPALQDFVDERGLEGFSESEVLELYAEAFTEDRKAARSQRLRQRQIALLRRLEGMANEAPLASDSVAGWFDEITASKLITAGFPTLGDLSARISMGGRWFSHLPAVGISKAGRIASYLSTILVHEALPPGGDHDFGPISQELLLGESSDLQVVQRWIQAKAGSPATARLYQKEMQRLLLWLKYECRGAALTQMQAPDCEAFMSFLKNIPAHWISRARASPGKPGWAPFRGQLSNASSRQAIVIIASMFSWLQTEKILDTNPWLLVRKDAGDNGNKKMMDNHALSETAMQEVLKFVDAQAPSLSRARIRFILLFVEAVGLRSAELLSTTLGDLRMESKEWVMQVHGKGAKNRVVSVPKQALHALEDYLQARCLGSMKTAPPGAPLLSSVLNPAAPIGYQSLYEHVKGWLAKAVKASSLPASEKNQLLGATTHWLRHTFGNRAVAKEVPLKVIQAQMGHASIQTTTAIYGRKPIKQRSLIIQASDQASGGESVVMPPM